MTGDVNSPLRSYLLMLRWQYLRMRGILPLLVVMQVLLGLGVVFGLVFLVPHVSSPVALYFATGAPTLSLVMIGLSVVPQETALSRTDGRFAYLSALPLPRLAPMLADVTFWLFVQLPGTVITLLVAVARFHLHLHVNPALLLLSLLLIALTTSSLGYAIAVSLRPSLVSPLSSALSIVLLLFAPINFPLSRLPGWLQGVHRVLPISYQADLVRGSLTGGYGTRPALALAVVGGWCAVALLISGRAVGRPS